MTQEELEFYFGPKDSGEDDLDLPDTLSVDDDDDLSDDDDEEDEDEETASDD